MSQVCFYTDLLAVRDCGRRKGSSTFGYVVVKDREPKNVEPNTNIVVCDVLDFTILYRTLTNMNRIRWIFLSLSLSLLFFSYKTTNMLVVPARAGVYLQDKQLTGETSGSIK